MKEKISSQLVTFTNNLEGINIEPTLDKRTNKRSNWSKSFSANDGEELETLSNVFGFPITHKVKALFESATSGDGDERRKILTLHSSSLLAFICFHQISSVPITIDGIVYDEIMFEVKNDVISAALGKPSNVDVFLLGEHRKNLLFIESKFTEYLNGGRAYLSEERYKAFYDILLTNNLFHFNASKLPVRHKPDKEHAEPYFTDEYCLNTGEQTKGYYGGIKQAFSHLLGIGTGPAIDQAKGNELYNLELLDSADEIKFASIVFNCDNKKYTSYNNLYTSIFTNEGAIKESINEVLRENGINHENIIGKLKILPNLLSYQTIFEDYPLHQNIRIFYSLLNDGDFNFNPVS